MYEKLSQEIKEKSNKYYWSLINDIVKGETSVYNDDIIKNPNSLTWATEDWNLIESIKEVLKEQNLQNYYIFTEDLSTIDFVENGGLSFWSMAYAPKSMNKSQVILEAAAWYNKANIPSNTENYLYWFNPYSAKILCLNTKNTDDGFYLISVWIEADKIDRKEIVNYSDWVTEDFGVPAFSNDNLVNALKSIQQVNKPLANLIWNYNPISKEDDFVTTFISAANDSRFTLDNYIDINYPDKLQNAMADSTFTSIIEQSENKIADRFIWTSAVITDALWTTYLAQDIILGAHRPEDTSDYIYKYHNCSWASRCLNINEDNPNDDYWFAVVCIWGEKYENTIVWPTVTINTEGDGTTNIQNGSAVNNTFSFTASFNEGLHGNIEVTATVGEVTDMGDGNYIVDNITEDTIITVKFTTVYNINVLYNTEQGSVTNATGSVIGGGSSLYTFQVHPLIGYGIDDVSITSGQASIVNNASADTFKEYTIFYITSDITVTVTFVEV